MINALFSIVDFLLNILITIIIVQAILSWLIAFNVVSLHNDFVSALWQALRALTEPMLRPIRRIMPDFGQLDLSPMVLIILVIIAQQLIGGLRVELLYG